MSEWQAVVVKLDNIERHPNADTLQMADVLGNYKVIFKEGQYQNGDLASYIPVDSICSNHPEFDWLGDKKRIKPIKLRGIFSLGILASPPPNSKEGDSVVEYYGLKKHIYEEEVADQINTDNEHAPSGWSLPHYDLEALRKYGHVLELGEEVIINEKIEGANSSFVFDGERLWVKSRNFFKKEDDLNIWWAAAKRIDLATKLKPFPMMAFYGELYGNVKGWKYDCVLDDNKKVVPQLRFFDVLDINAKRFLDWDDAKKMIEAAGLKPVPELYRGAWKGKEMWSLAEGNSTIGECIREGFVVRPIKERYNYHCGRIVLKMKGEGYSLKKK